jgi:hypothetical protein
MLIQPKITPENVSLGESGVEALAAKRNQQWTISPALNFTVTERGNYVLLQAELAKAKFYTTVIGGSGTSPLQLPPGTYHCYGTHPEVNSAHAAPVFDGFSECWRCGDCLRFRVDRTKPNLRVFCPERILLAKSGGTIEFSQSERAPRVPGGNRQTETLTFNDDFRAMRSSSVLGSSSERRVGKPSLIRYLC